jgi:peptidoglycan biosynthesis protein MviN/MurJ (putative lipid II flippase)
MVQVPGRARARSTARDSMTVAAWTVISRLVGLLRVLVVGAVMGPTYLANVFQAAYVLGGNVFTVLAGPVLAMVVVPSVVSALTAGGTDRAGALLGRVTGRLLGLAGGGTLALMLASPLVAWALVFGVPEAERPRAWLITVVLILFVAPQVLVYALSGLAVAAQQARGHFALPAAAQALESLGAMITVALAGWLFGTGLEVGQAPMAMILLLGAGSTGSVCLLAALQVYGAWRAGVPIRPRRGWRADAEAAAVVRRIGRSVPVSACPVATNFLLTAVAGTVPGGVLVIQLSYQVFYGLSFVGARAVSMAALPRLSRAAATGDEPGFAAAWRQGLYYAVLVSLPALALLAAFSGPTADLLANGELRQGDLIVMLAGCLAVVAVAQLVGGVHDLGRQALFARLDDRGPRLAGYWALAAGCGVGSAALLLPAGPARLTCLALAILAAELAAATLVVTRLRAAVRGHGFVDRARLGAAGVAVLVTLPVIVAARWLLARLDPARVLELALLMGTGVLTLAVYALVVRTLGRRIAPPDPTPATGPSGAAPEAADLGGSAGTREG